RDVGACTRGGISGGDGEARMEVAERRRPLRELVEDRFFAGGSGRRSLAPRNSRRRRLRRRCSRTGGCRGWVIARAGGEGEKRGGEQGDSRYLPESRLRSSAKPQARSA